MDGETDEQKQLGEQRNADRARRRADEERQLAPHNLSDAFDMVGDQQVYKTPSANMAVAMANLDRLPDTPECQGVRSSIRAHLIAAMGQTATLLDSSQRSKLSPTQRSLPTRLIAAGLHHNPGSATVAALPTIAGRMWGTTTVVGTPVVTASRSVGVVRM